MAKIIKEEIMLTTKDNPYDPFTQFNDWYNFDCEKGYFSYNYLDRIVDVNNKMSPFEKEIAYDNGMKEIVKMNPDLYAIVSKNVEVDEFDLNYNF